MELRRTETGFALYKEKEAIGHCTLHPAAQGADLAALTIDPAWRRKRLESRGMASSVEAFDKDSESLPGESAAGR